MKFSCRIQMDARLVTALAVALVYGGAAAGEQVKAGTAGAALLAVGLFFGHGRVNKGPSGCDPARHGHHRSRSRSGPGPC
ncbi:hypothetical protein [Actinoallomurus iriomotensis]|uniref:Uncharacterized protein n=1 Tax=Actinoallomurus iriomotensis TaxID=478107 RepID=A0A9W6SAM3_9ACTN|nr:hypothetical protein [Actinoallomurus iriomotensis]GLY88752.1 hypothetical protein Airi02_066810 [Actinoallomurus iriomotensis]